jgi:GTPase SAR1 family protein
MMMKDLMSGEDSEDLQTRKVVVMGSVGSGKTSLCHYGAGLYELNEKSKMSGHSVTKGVHMCRGKYIKLDSRSSRVQYTFIDMEGYGADNYSGDVLINNLIDTLRFETEINAVIIVASFERFRLGLKDNLAQLLKDIGSVGLGKENTILCFTHCELYSETIKKNYVEEFRKYYNFDIEDQNIIYSCFPNIDEINEVYHPLIIEDVKISIKKLRETIYDKNTTINSAVKIREIDINANTKTTETTETIV